MTLADQITHVSVQILSERIGIMVYTGKVKREEAERVSIEETATYLSRHFSPLKKEQAIQHAQRALATMVKHPEFKL